MADNIQVRDALGTANYFRTNDIGSNVHVPIHRLDGLNVTGPAAQSAVNTDLLSGTVNGWYDASVFFSGTVQIVASAGITAGAIIFEQTNDNSSTTGIALAAQEVSVVNSNPIVAAVAIAASTRRAWQIPITMKYVRVRISTAFAGGTVQAFATFSQQPYAYPALNVQQATAASLLTTATISGTPTVASQDNIFFNESTTAQAASATVTGTARDVGVAAAAVHRYSAFNVMAFADVAGTVRIECSNDNTTWRRASADTAVAANAVVYLSVPVVTRYYRAVYVNGATLQTAFMLNTSFTAS